MTKKALAVIVLAAALTSCRDGRAAALLARDSRQTIESGGRTRVYFVHHPSSAKTGAPVVLLLHGGTGTAEGMQRIAHFNQVSDAHGFVAVYPQGYRRSWNDGRGNTPAARDGVDDVAFISALVDRLVATDGVDKTRVLAGGLSNGAFMSQRLGCELADKIKAIAPVAGPMGTNLAATCHPARTVSVLEVHGTDDPLIPYNGGHDNGRGGGGDDLSVIDTYNRWRTLDACPASVDTRLPDKVNDGTHVVVHTSRPCRDSGAVELYTVEGGGHTWPGGEQYLPAAVVGKTSRQFDASETIWEFFAGLS